MVRCPTVNRRPGSHRREFDSRRLRHGGCLTPERAASETAGFATLPRRQRLIACSNLGAHKERTIRDATAERLRELSFLELALRWRGRKPQKVGGCAGGIRLFRPSFSRFADQAGDFGVLRQRVDQSADR